MQANFYFNRDLRAQLEMNIVCGVLLYVLFLISGTWCGMIPGKGCGVDTPYHIVKNLSPDDDIEDMECVFVRDERSFQKVFVDNKPGIVCLHLKVPIT